VLRVQDMAQELVAGGPAHLRILVSSSLSLALAPKAIAALRRRAGTVRVSLDVLPPPELIESIANHQGDLGIALSPGTHAAVTAETVAKGGLICIAPQGHPLADLTEVRAIDLATLPLISFDRATSLGRAIDDAFIADGVQRDIAIEVASTPVAVALVMQGAGVAVIEALALPADALTGIVARKFASTARFDLTLLRNRAHPSSAAADVLTAELKNQVLEPVVSEVQERS
jgi:DNA-binding transcriptional LysR family regulator